MINLWRFGLLHAHAVTVMYLTHTSKSSIPVLIPVRLFQQHLEISGQILGASALTSVPLKSPGVSNHDTHATQELLSSLLLTQLHRKTPLKWATLAA